MALGVGTTVAYEAILGWDHERVVGPDGGVHGPYEAWQVLLLGALLVFMGSYVAYRGHWDTPWVIPPVLTVVWSLDAVLHPVEQPDMWPVGAVFLLVGSAVVTLVLTAGIEFLTNLRTPRSDVFDATPSVLTAVFGHLSDPRRRQTLASGAAPAGWYPDPVESARWRWWDGSAWTDTTG